MGPRKGKKTKKKKKKEGPWGFPGGSAGEGSSIVTAVAQVPSLAQEILHATNATK